MKYVDNLNDFLDIVSDKPCSVIGLHKKHPKKAPFHQGHIHCINEMKKLDADYTVCLLWDSELGCNYLFNRHVKERPLDLDYMKYILGQTGIDIFYYLTHKDFMENWIPRIESENHLSFIYDVIKKEGYKLIPDHFIPAYTFDRFFNRKYSIGSSKDDWRFPLKDFCKKYTNTEVVIIQRLKNQMGKVYTSSGGIT